MKENEISLKTTDGITCPFCNETVKDHSHKNLKRHFHKMYNSGLAMQNFVREVQGEVGRLQLLLMAIKRIKGEVDEKELEKTCKEIQEEVKKEFEKTQNTNKEINVVSKVE